MNEQIPTPEPLHLSVKELQHLLREGDPPLTRRELRLRHRAEEAGLLTRSDGRLVIAEQPAPPAAPPRAEEPPTVTSADVLAGKVPAASGLTRRQLRELAAQHTAENTLDTGELEETLESTPVTEPAEPEQPAPRTPQRVSTRVVASELAENKTAPAPEQPAEQTARRPVVRPEGAQTGQYTGEFDQIRRAMADINAAPDTPAPEPAAPKRRSVFEASVPAELSEEEPGEETPAEQTDAADWTAVIDSPVVTDNLLPNFEPVEPAVPETEAGESTEEPSPQRTAGEPEEESEAEGESPAPGDDRFNFPDWHTLTSIPAVTDVPESEPLAAAPQEAPEPKRTGSPMWLTVLQWLVIAVVAVVLGLLVWYAINRGFGTGGNEAAGILSPLYHLRI